MTNRPSPHASPLRAANLLAAGFPHGFSTRAGGVSEPPFDTLNFGPGDASANVEENVRRFGQAVGFDPGALRQVNQVHGARVVDAETTAAPGAGPREEADALFLRPGGSSGARAVGIRVADCVPILIGARASGSVAAVHAGWRGVVAGVVANAIERMASRGGADELIAAVGPCIAPCCFEVGAEVGAQVATACGDQAVIARLEREGEKAYLNLQIAVVAQLTRAGVRDVETIAGCTRCDAERFFSFRRDGERSGRHIAVIALRPA